MELFTNVSYKLGGNSNFTMKYAFNVRTIKCHFWNETTMRWSSNECVVCNRISLIVFALILSWIKGVSALNSIYLPLFSIYLTLFSWQQIAILVVLVHNMMATRKPGLETRPDKLHCRCSHLSTFSGSLLAPENKEDLFKIIPMLILNSENIVIPIFVACILTLYIIISVWAKWNDKHDIYDRVVTVLEDNIPGRSYTYLIGVHTGFRRNAGTSSNVGIQIIGENVKSKVHVLKDNTRAVHSRNSDCWFVIFSSRDLGELTTLRLWHDNSGHHPPWYCERVVVQDIQKNTCWKFLVRRWLSLIHGGGNVYCSLEPATPSVLKQWLLLFKDNVKLGFQEQHIWSNIFMRHPWSTYTRVERLTVALFIIITTMLSSLLLYEIPKGTPADQIDEADFHFPEREFGTLLEAGLILTPFHFIFVLLFRKTAPRKIKYNPQAEAILVEASKEKQKTTWWKRVLFFFMLEPLIHPPKVKTELMVTEVNTTPVKEKEGSETELKQQFKASKYWLPFWVTFITWTLCGLIIIASAAILVFLGLLYAIVMSEMWVVAVLMYIALSIFILQPLKVVLFSLVLSFICKEESSNMQEVGVYFVKKAKEREEWERIQAKIKKLRMQQMYRPLKTQDIMKLKRLERTRAQLADLFIDICMFLVYIIALYWLFLGTRDNLAYYSTYSVRESIIFTDKFSTLKSGIEFIKYMNKTLLPAIHSDKWYNEAKMNSLGNTNLYDTKLLGVIRLRQIRIKNESCQVVKQMQEFWNSCNAEFNVAYEDKQNYDIRWEQFDKFTYRETRATTPWIYKTGWESGTVPVAGKLALYPGGGYITILGRTLKNSQLTFYFLVQEKWLNSQTRALFIEFTLYNANRNIFNIVTMILEFAPTGAMHTEQDIRTVKLLLSFQEFGPMILVAFVLWVMVLVLFILRQMAKFGHISLRNYFRSWWNIIDIIIFILALTTIILFILRSKYTSHLIKELEESDGNEYVNFMWAGFWQVLLRYFMAVLLGLSTARLWKLLRFLQQFRNFEHTLVRASKTLFFLAFMMFTMITACALFSYLFLSSSTHLFSSILSSYTRMILYGTGFTGIGFVDFFKQDSFIGHIFIVVFWVMYVIYLMNMFITILNISYEQSNAEIGLFQEDYTMLDYIREEIQYMCRCKRYKRSAESGKELSVREKYPHYFGQDKTQANSTLRGENPQNGNDKENNIRVGALSRNGRLRAGADVPPESGYSPAIAVPKPRQITNQNVEILPNNRLQTMQYLACHKIQEQNSQKDIQEQMIVSFIQSHMEQFKSNNAKEHGIFYRGLDGTKQKLVPDDKLLQMETVINKLGAEKFAAQKNDYNDLKSDDESIDDDNVITPEESLGHADVLALQMNRLDRIISDWGLQESLAEVKAGEDNDRICEDSGIEYPYETEDKDQSTDKGKYESQSTIPMKIKIENQNKLDDLAPGNLAKTSEILQNSQNATDKSSEVLREFSKHKPENEHQRKLTSDQEESGKERSKNLLRLPIKESIPLEDAGVFMEKADNKANKHSDNAEKNDKQNMKEELLHDKPKDTTSSKAEDRIESRDIDQEQDDKKKPQHNMGYLHKTGAPHRRRVYSNKMKNNGKQKVHHEERGPQEDEIIPITTGVLLQQDKMKYAITEDDEGNVQENAKKSSLHLTKENNNQIEFVKHKDKVADKVTQEKFGTKKRGVPNKTAETFSNIEKRSMEEEAIAPRRVDQLYTGKAYSGDPKKKLQIPSSRRKSPKKKIGAITEKFTTPDDLSTSHAVGSLPPLSSPVAAMETIPPTVIGSLPSTSTEAKTTSKDGIMYLRDYCGLFLKEKSGKETTEQNSLPCSHTATEAKTQSKFRVFSMESQVHNPFSESTKSECSAELQRMQFQLDANHQTLPLASSVRLDVTECNNLSHPSREGILSLLEERISRSRIIEMTLPQEVQQASHSSEQLSCGTDHEVQLQDRLNEISNFQTTDIASFTIHQLDQKTPEMNPFHALPYQPPLEDERNFTEMLPQVSSLFGSFSTHEENDRSYRLPSSSSLLENYNIHRQFSMADEPHFNEEYHQAISDVFPTNNMFQNANEDREFQEGYLGQGLTRPSIYTRAERPLEYDLNNSIERNIYTEPIREQQSQLADPKISENTPVLTVTNTLLSDSVPYQDLQIPFESHPVQQNRLRSLIPEENGLTYTRNISSRQSSGTGEDRNRIGSSAGISEIINDTEENSRNSIINSLEGLDELRIAVHLNSRNLTMEGIHNQTDQQEERTSDGINITLEGFQNQINQHKYKYHIRSNDRDKIKYRVQYNSQLHTECQQEMQNGSIGSGQLEEVSTTGRRRRRRNNKDSYAEASEIVYPFSIPNLVFPLESPYIDVTYFSPYSHYSSSYMNPFSPPYEQNWTKNDSRYMQFGFERRYNHANSQYMPFEGDIHRPVHTQRYNRLINTETEEERHGENGEFHQGRQMTSQRYSRQINIETQGERREDNSVFQKGWQLPLRNYNRQTNFETRGERFGENKLFHRRRQLPSHTYSRHINIEPQGERYGENRVLQQGWQFPSQRHSRQTYNDTQGMRYEENRVFHEGLQMSSQRDVQRYSRRISGPRCYGLAFRNENLSIQNDAPMQSDHRQPNSINEVRPNTFQTIWPMSHYEPSDHENARGRQRIRSRRREKKPFQ